MNLTILGGGNLAHSIAVTASFYFKKISILTSNRELWNDRLTAIFPDGNKVIGRDIAVSEKAEEAILGSDVILSTLPGHIIPERLREIKRFMKPGQMVGSVTAAGGFFWIARGVLGKSIPLFAFQRVPFICRIIEKGKSVNISGLKKELFVASIGVDGYQSQYNSMISLMKESFATDIIHLNSYLEATISNSNPILHTTRLCSMIKNPADKNNAFFYREWDDDTSKLLLKCDQEVVQIIEKLGKPFPLFKTILEHYEVGNWSELTLKMRSIKAFSDITFPMIEKEKGVFFPDSSSRYFLEDVPYGLLILRSMADICGIATPNMDKVILELQNYLEKEYIENSELKGKNIGDTGIPENYGIKTKEQLINLF
jgi:opine dehydrogenase